jgi:hypothetical protein
LDPSTREGTQRLGLVTLQQMIAALVRAVENPAHGVRVVEIPEIRQAGTRGEDTEILRASSA